MVNQMKAILPTLDQIWNWLDQVVDPEIPVLSVVDLGIVRDLSWNEDQGEQNLIVTVTPTYSGCPATAVIKQDIFAALRERGIEHMQIETRLSPAWTTEWLSEKGRTCLRQYGIAPPHRSDDDFKATPTATQGCRPANGLGKVIDLDLAIECPRCGSTKTRMVSQFGSTPCKAFYVCDTCREPFDYFKCH
jgi:ring-1,2-phenylacetyl-CoA epoxidase subunit PaaD